MYAVVTVVGSDVHKDGVHAGNVFDVDTASAVSDSNVSINVDTSNVA